MDEYFESLSLQVFNTTVCAIWRQSSGCVSEFMTFFENALCCICSLNAPFMILGDINIDTMSSSMHANPFQDVVHQYACRNVITLPTVVKATFLDICVTNTDSNSLSAGVILNDISDHLRVFYLASSSYKKQHNTENLLLCTINETALDMFSCLIKQADRSSTMSIIPQLRFWTNLNNASMQPSLYDRVKEEKNLESCR